MTKLDSVPSVRFPEFKESWFSVQLKDTLDYISYGFTNPMPEADFGPYMLTAKEVKGGKILYSEARRTTDEAYTNLLTPKSRPCINDILLTKDGTLGRLALVDKSGICINQSIAVLRPNSLSNSKFIYHLLTTPKYQNIMLRNAGGSTIKHIYITVVDKMKIGIASTEEQQKIASFLSKVDEKIALLTEKKGKLTEYKKGVMQQLFNGSFQEQDGQLTFIPPTLRFKADDGSEYPDWEETNIGSLGKVITGSTPKTSDTDNYGGDRLFISPADINEKKYIHSTKNSVTQKGFNSGRIIPKHSVCFVCIGSTIGKVAMNAHESITNQQINSIVVDKTKFDAGFVFAALLKESFKIKLLAGEQAVPIINKSEFSRYKLLVPTKPEQTKIASFLSAIDQKIDLANSELEKAKEWKEGLLQQMFV